jgi:hypothetical protein
VNQDPKTPISAADLHNVRCRYQQSSSEIPTEIVLAAEVAGRPEHTPEVEDLLLRLDADSFTVTRTDGERIVLDRAELEAFLGA